jgi:glycosyltransferase involved in cell wall biosynthesis
MKLSLITATYQRSRILAENALPSVLTQHISPANFEWIVVNDGADPATAALVSDIPSPFPVVHISMPHPETGFGLCHARNRGIEAASGDIVAYLDDDNAISPEFAAKTLQFFKRNPQLHGAMVRQSRRRDTPTRQGKPFVAPAPDCTTTELIRQDELFDSNGFAHRRQGAPDWNPDFRIFCDYEYFLRCIQSWGHDAFAIHQTVLVDYVQTTDGIIGQSSYGAWAQELLHLCEAPEQYPAIGPHAEHLMQLAQQWQARAHQRIKAFQAA